MRDSETTSNSVARYLTLRPPETDAIIQYNPALSHRWSSIIVATMIPRRQLRSSLTGFIGINLPAVILLKATTLGVVIPTNVMLIGAPRPKTMTIPAYISSSRIPS